MNKIGENNFESANGNGRRDISVFWLWLFIFICVDQFIKYFIFSRAFSFPLTHFKNFYFAFSVPLPVALMYVLYGGVLLLAGVYFFKKYKTMEQLQFWAWLLIFAGGASNVFERLALGYVRDYLYIGAGIFNLADMYILAGVAILFLQPLMKK